MKITTEARIEVTTPREIRERVSIELALLASILRSSSKWKLDLYFSLAAPSISIPSLKSSPQPHIYIPCLRISLS